MSRFSTVLLTTALVSSLLVGGVAAEAKGGHSGGNSGGSPSTSQSSTNHANAKAQTGVTEKDQAKVQAQDKTQAQKKIDFENQAKLKTVKESKTQAKVEAKQFKDTDKHWAEAAIQRLQMEGIVSGFPDGEFRPDDPVTQTQVIAMVMGAFDNEQTTTVDQTSDEVTTDETNTEDEISDVPDWAKGTVQKALEKGILTRSMNRFHSQTQASRVQSMVWVAKALGLEPVDTSEMPFTDSDLVTTEDMGYVMALYDEGIIKGGPGGELNPNSSITRAQIAAIIDRVLNEQSAEGTDQQESTGTSDSTADSTTTDTTSTDTTSTDTTSTDTTSTDTTSTNTTSTDTTNTNTTSDTLPTNTSTN